MERTASSTEGRSEARLAVVAVDMGGRSSLSAGPSLLQVSQTKKKVWSTVNIMRWPCRLCCHREDVLQLQENIVERTISIATAWKKNHARSPPCDLRRVIAFGALCSAGEFAQPSSG